jgi:hypothetical protein
MANTTVRILLFFLLFSCGTNRVQQIAEQGKQYTDKEIEALAKDCEYVNNLVGKGMKKAKDKKGQTRRYKDAYLRNDFLVKVLGKTHCLDGQSIEHIHKQLGEPTLSCLDEKYCIGLYLEYTFIIDDDEFYSVNLYFVDNHMTEIVRNGKVKVITSH